MGHKTVPRKVLRVPASKRMQKSTEQERQAQIDSIVQAAAIHVETAADALTGYGLSVGEAWQALIDGFAKRRMEGL